MMSSNAKKVLTVMAALLGLVLAPVFADYDAGLAYFKQGKYVESAAEWEAVIANAPEYSFGYYMLGNCYFKLKKYRDAEPQFRKAVELDPGKFNYHLNLAQTLMSLRKYGETVQVLDEAEDLATTPQEKLLLHRLRGLSLGQVKDYQRAVKDLKQAGPAKSHQVASALARACYQTSDYNCIKTAAEQALKLKSSDEKTLTLLVRATLEKARRTKNKAQKKAVYKQAAGYASRLIPIAKKAVKAHELRGAALLGAEDFKGSIAEFQEVLKTDPKSCNAMMNIATAYQQLENWNAVIDWAGKTTRCNPKSSNAYGKIAFAYNKMKKWNEAIGAADKALAIKGGDSWAKAQKQIAEKGIEADAHNQAVAQDEADYEAQLEIERQREAEEAERLRKWEILHGTKKEGDGASKDGASKDGGGKDGGGK